MYFEVVMIYSYSLSDSDNREVVRLGHFISHPSILVASHRPFSINELIQFESRDGHL
ncbi:hypothetical protein BGZ61DRAFT_84499 [Ilyonectria robusta]|uniref:uncharacterized protein n=1 Tax=Ilyonectria robusta TaxID=1079257 RepID=UPI001E8E7BB4|nr:uncharacterized protein BGZ61DRAFT_84499 [Ilyonectria robusta]KAH8735727.1 hypothetical protein BGZ61DRAFT_84499 [Ilyonectria robusta]